MIVEKYTKDYHVKESEYFKAYDEGGIILNYKSLLVEVENHVAKISFNRPQVLNAFDAETITELDNLIEYIAYDETIYCNLQRQGRELCCRS